MPENELTIELRSGGDMTLTVKASIISMSDEDREFIFDIVDTIKAYESDEEEEDEIEVEILEDPEEEEIADVEPVPRKDVVRSVDMTVDCWGRKKPTIFRNLMIACLYERPRERGQGGCMTITQIRESLVEEYNDHDRSNENLAAQLRELMTRHDFVMKTDRADCIAGRSSTAYALTAEGRDRAREVINDMVEVS